jgi:3-oxoacyl-[acyl-carrier-protein] synthase-3
VAYIQSFGAYLPEHVVTNVELAARLKCEPEWIEDMSGIRERRYSRKDETVIDMAVAAAAKCLDQNGLDPASIGMVIVASGTGERRFPGPAASTASRLGLNGVPALDVPIASAGSLFGLAVANDMASRYGAVLLMATEKMSGVKFGNPVEKGTAILFGDGAGACVVTEAPGAIRLIDTVLHSDGNFAQDLRLEHNGGVLMNGRSVIMQATRKIPAVIKEVLDRNKVRPCDVAAFLMHQANQNLIDRVARTLGVDSTCFYSNIGRYGNTSSASMLIAASEWWDAERPRPGSRIAFAAFGAGFHWGAILAEVF